MGIHKVGEAIYPVTPEQVAEFQENHGKSGTVGKYSWAISVLTLLLVSNHNSWESIGYYQLVSLIVHQYFALSSYSGR